MSNVEIISVIVLLALILFSAFYFVGRRNRQKEKELIQSRTSDTPEQFLESFSEDERQIAAALYRELQKQTYTKKVPFRKTDDLASLNMDADDLEHALKRIAKQLGYRLKPKATIQVKTIQDCVELIHRFAATQN